MDRPPPSGADRRRFLGAAGAGVVAAAGPPGPAAAQQPSSPGGPGLPPAREPGIATGRGIPAEARGQPMPKLLEPLPLPPGDRVGFAVVGLGKFALNQIIAAFADCQRSRLVALVSGDAEKARRVAERYGVDRSATYGYRDFERIAENPAVEVVYVILPNGLHAEWTQRAFRAGKHVLCEKPMANTPEECRRMIEAGRQADRKLMIAYRAQYEPYNLKAIELARSGELGELRTITAEHGRPLEPDDPADQWRMQKELAGGGSLYDIGIYAVQAMRYISGEEPVEVRAMMHSPPTDPRFREVEDVVTWQFRMPSGLLTAGTTSYSYHPANRVHVQGTKAALRLDPATSYYERKMWITRGENETAQLQLRDANQFALEMDHMAQAVREGREPKTPGEEGLRDVIIMHAIYESARTGRPVRLEHPLVR